MELLGSLKWRWGSFKGNHRDAEQKGSFKGNDKAPLKGFGVI